MHQNQQQPRRDVRLGGGYQKRAPDEPPSVAQEAKPAQPPASAPASGGNAAAPSDGPKPKRFLYTARRKLTPGEISKQRPRE